MVASLSDGGRAPPFFIKQSLCLVLLIGWKQLKSFSSFLKCAYIFYILHCVNQELSCAVNNLVDTFDWCGELSVAY